MQDLEMDTVTYNKINDFGIDLDIKGQWVGKYASSPINLNNEQIINCLEVDKELQNKYNNTYCGTGDCCIKMNQYSGVIPMCIPLIFGILGEILCYPCNYKSKETLSEYILITKNGIIHYKTYSDENENIVTGLTWENLNMDILVYANLGEKNTKSRISCEPRWSDNRSIVDRHVQNGGSPLDCILSFGCIGGFKQLETTTMWSGCIPGYFNFWRSPIIPDLHWLSLSSNSVNEWTCQDSHGRETHTSVKQVYWEIAGLKMERQKFIDTITNLLNNKKVEIQESIEKGFNIGDHVISTFKDGNYYSGVIEGINEEENYIINYDDGGREKNVPSFKLKHICSN